MSTMEILNPAAAGFKRFSEVCPAKKCNSPWSIFLIAGVLAVPATWYIAPDYAQWAISMSIPLFGAACYQIDRVKAMYVVPYLHYLATLDIEQVRHAAQSADLDDVTLKVIRQFMDHAAQEKSSRAAAAVNHH